MEFLIPGLILVALMVYASTKIKRASAEAWASVTVTTRDFTILKPDGVLHVLNSSRNLLFEGYAREFGTGGASKTRIARIEVEGLSGTTATNKVRELKSSTKLIEQATQTVDGKKYVMLDTEEPAAVLKYRVLYKVVESAGRVFVLTIRMLEEADDEMRAKLDVMAESFVLN